MHSIVAIRWSIVLLFFSIYRTRQGKILIGEGFGILLLFKHDCVKAVVSEHRIFKAAEIYLNGPVNSSRLELSLSLGFK